MNSSIAILNSYWASLLFRLYFLIAQLLDTDMLLVGSSFFWHSLQIGKSFVVSKLKDYPQFHSVAIAINRSGFKVCLICLQSPCLFTVFE